MIFGKYSLYIYLSYTAAAVLFIGLVYHAKLMFKRAKRHCYAMLKEKPDASAS